MQRPRLATLRRARAQGLEQSRAEVAGCPSKASIMALGTPAFARRLPAAAELAPVAMPVIPNACVPVCNAAGPLNPSVST
jgi:hypothetical protein